MPSVDLYIVNTNNFVLKGFNSFNGRYEKFFNENQTVAITYHLKTKRTIMIIKQLHFGLNIRTCSVIDRLFMILYPN